MADWLIIQTAVISTAVIILITLKKPLLATSGARGYYFLWSVVPLQLMLSLLMNPQLAPNSPEITKIVVTASFYHEAISSSVEGSGLNLLLIWGAGMLAMLSVILLTHHIRMRQIDRKKFEVPAEWRNTANVSVLGSKAIQAPQVTGLISPHIILPQDFGDYSPTMQSMILQHEITHHQRGDIYWNLLATLILSVQWFNPLAWIGYRHFRQAQELSCDSIVLATRSDSERLDYAKTFLNKSLYQPSLPFTALNYSGMENIKERLINMKRKTNRQYFSLPITVLVLGFTLIFQTIGYASMAPGKKSNEVSPLTRVEPLYPKEAAEQGIEGSVVLQFSIDTKGNVKNVNVIKAIPENVFNNNAKIALEQWTYTRPATQLDNMLVQLDFLLAPKGKENLLAGMEQIRVEPAPQDKM